MNGVRPGIITDIHADGGGRTAERLTLPMQRGGEAIEVARDSVAGFGRIVRWRVIDASGGDDKTNR